MTRQIIMVDVCTKCTVRCRYCSPHKDSVDGHLMSLADFKRIARMIARDGYNYVYLYNTGEPMLHPDIFTFLAILRDLNVSTQIATKLSCRIDWDKFEACPPTESLVTLDALEEDKAKEIAPGINYGLVRRNIDSLAALSHKPTFKGSIVFNTTVCSLNKAELDAIQAFIESKFSSSNTSVGNKAMGIAFGCSTPDEVHKAVEFSGGIVEPSFREVRFKVDGDTVVPLYDQRSWPNGRVCDPVPAIGYDGGLYPCCHDMMYKCCMGNVLEAGGVKRVLSSAVGRRTMSAARKFLLPICKFCN